MKKSLPDIIAIIAFVVISVAYFFPAITEGRVLAQHDSVASIGLGQESKEFTEKTGEKTRWTNAIFGGMPTYQISPTYDSTNVVRGVENVYKLFLPDYVYMVFIMLLGFYILMRAFDFSVYLSVLGAIVWAFSSYFFIIIGAGHIWKFVTLAYIPPTIAGIVLAYRKKYLIGGVLTAFFIALQILSNHVQMTYYFLFVILFMVIAYFVEAYKNKELPHFFKASGVLVIAALVGVSVNISNLYHTYKYSKDTMRGKSELVKQNSANQTNSGLERDYIVQWSYGIGETFSLLVPDVKGGASVPLANNESAMKKADPTYAQLYAQIGQYWGEQPGTSGPVYVGAFILTLFILGLFIVKTPVKWALLAATVLSILLSWGKNFMGFTDFFLDYIPMYSKFRAVSSILVIAEFTIPLLAILALKEIVEKPEILKQNLKQFYISLGLTGGVALLFALAPTLFFPSYISSGEMQALQNGIPAEQLSPIIANLTQIRQSIFTSDAWRSVIIILIGAALVLAYNAGKLKANLMVLALTVLCLGDMWSVDKRYLKDSDFIEPEQRMVSVQKTQTDEYILRDKSLDYRVLNFAVSTFNDNNTSYWHKSVGGYHPAKLRRYQEMIDHHISKEMAYLQHQIPAVQGDMTKINPDSISVINMLNTKYFIFPTGNSQTAPLQNPYAYGNAWFVENVKYVQNANEEIDALNTTVPTKTAVVSNDFKQVFNGVQTAFKDSLSTVKLTSYAPNALTYETSSSKDGVVVFSEIYYPGWQAYLDGQAVDHGRADYILRAMKVPAGKHKIEFKFDPQSIHTTENIAYVALGVLILGAIGVIVIEVRKKKQ
ncbi:membrane protein YfhO [Bacteroides luti]|uniref:Membrane protein YfhO n=1 Tax=Bacteroides luti TaxID=1297750 RepID=A0A1M4YJU4_9BACE|nr:YfhO family protein [Bacteroides luti]SHF06000.1 membrane protein YfhO [Bacteroides luti]